MMSELMSIETNDSEIDILKGRLYTARLIEYSTSFFITIIISLIVIIRVKCQLEGFTYVVMGVLFFSQVANFTGYLVLTIGNKIGDFETVSKFAPLMVTISQFCSLSIILFYTYQMQLIYERLKQPKKRKDSLLREQFAITVTFGNNDIDLEDILIEDFDEYQTKKQRVRMFWIFLQIVILINYILELWEGYIKGWKLGGEDQEKQKQIQSIILYANRAL